MLRHASGMSYDKKNKTNNVPMEDFHHGSLPDSVDSIDAVAVPCRFPNSKCVQCSCVAHILLDLFFFLLGYRNPMCRQRRTLMSSLVSSLHDVNAYFTPGELVAVMGPTGAWKKDHSRILQTKTQKPNQQQMLTSLFFPL